MVIKMDKSEEFAKSGKKLLGYNNEVTDIYINLLT